MNLATDPGLSIRPQPWLQFTAIRVWTVILIQVLIIGVAGHDYIWAKRYGDSKPFVRSSFDAVAAGFVSRELSYPIGKGEHAGEALLPEEYRDLTINGKCYVTQTDSGEWLIFFPSYVGRRRYVGGDAYVAGYLYDSRGGDRSVGDPIRKWIVDVSEPGRPLNAILQSVIPTNHLRLERPVASNWYSVETVSSPSVTGGSGAHVGLLW